MKQNGQILTSLAMLLLVIAVPSIYGQADQEPALASPALQQRPLGGDPIRQLNLTPQQREQIRTIRQTSQAERAAINERVSDSNSAIYAALNSDSP